MRFIFSFFLLVYTISCSGSSHRQTLFDHILKDFHQEMKEEFGLLLMGQKAKLSPKIQKVTLDYCHYDQIEVLEARLLIHKLADSLLHKLNQEPVLRKGLEHFPLTSQDLEISISFVDPKTHSPQRYESLSHVSLLGGRIHYSRHQAEEEISQNILQEEYR